jgi:hypothetical protein
MRLVKLNHLVMPLLLLLPLLAPPASQAAEVAPAAGYSIRALAEPSILSSEFNANNPEGDPNAFQVTVTNAGDRPTDGSPIVIRDELPAGLTAIRVTGVVGGSAMSGPNLGGESISCDQAAVQCVYERPLLPSQNLLMIVAVAVAPGTTGPVTDGAIVSGGGAPGASTNATGQIGTAAEALGAPFGVASVTAEATGVNGLLDQQAGDHPYETTISFTLNPFPRLGEYHSAGGGREGDAKDVVVETPPGFTGDPAVVERCPQYKVVAGACPPSTQIGFAKLSAVSRSAEPDEAYPLALPVYNVVPDKGYPAEFAIDIPSTEVVIPLYVTVSPESHYGVRVITPNSTQTGDPLEITVTLFGAPSRDESTFDEYRKAVTGVPPTAFLDNPVDCSTAPQVTTVSVDSWQNPGPWLADGQPDLSDPRWVSKSTTMFPSLIGCELLQFNASLSVLPDTTQADEPAGTTVDLHLPQAPQQLPGLVSPEFKETTVTLPSGLSLSPSAGDGLEGCTDAEISLSTAGAGSCPNGSQIGTLTAISPLLSEPLQGKVFLGTPHCDPCSNADASDGNMYRLFLQIEGSGVVVKLEGKIYANPTTGQLTSTFKDIPALPTSDVQLHFNSGSRAGLATPQSCGTFTSTADLTPWSTPITPDATPSSQFHVDWDGNGGGCPATTPFAPSFSAGTSNPNAGQFSPFTLTFGREDREQDLSDIQVHMPPGLSGILAGVTLCGEPQADLGTCSAASQIGKMTVAAGPGSHPFYEQGQIYLTGPYEGAPFGLSIVVPTSAGPFNLGNVVVRSQIDVNPETTALTVTSTPFPQILDGIPLRLRTANVTIDRPGFIFNPTDCAQQHITASIAGAQGAQANVSAPFAVAGCAGLHFGPQATVSTSGKTSKAGGASLDYKIAFPAGPQSNIAVAKVELPKQLPSRLTTLQKACTAAQFDANPAACPSASLIGIAKAITPLLPVPLVGPVYFVSHGGEAFPSLEVVLEGYGVRVDLVGSTFISKKGITSTTFKTVPDAPVSSFEIYLPEGKNSALAANGNLCKSSLGMPSTFTAQDGSQFKQDVKISVTGCPKAKAKPKVKAKPKAKKAKAGRTRTAGHERRAPR